MAAKIDIIFETSKEKEKKVKMYSTYKNYAYQPQTPNGAMALVHNKKGAGVEVPVPYIISGDGCELFLETNYRNHRNFPVIMFLLWFNYGHYGNSFP